MRTKSLSDDDKGIIEVLSESGMKTKDIARYLGVSLPTISKHRILSNKDPFLAIQKNLRIIEDYGNKFSDETSYPSWLTRQLIDTHLGEELRWNIRYPLKGHINFLNVAFFPEVSFLDEWLGHNERVVVAAYQVLDDNISEGILYRNPKEFVFSKQEDILEQVDASKDPKISKSEKNIEKTIDLLLEDLDMNAPFANKHPYDKDMPLSEVVKLRYGIIGNETKPKDIARLIGYNHYSLRDDLRKTNIYLKNHYGYRIKSMLVEGIGLESY